MSTQTAAGDDRALPRADDVTAPSSDFTDAIPDGWVAMQLEIRAAVVTSDAGNAWGMPSAGPGAPYVNDGSDCSGAAEMRPPPRYLAGCDISFIKGNDIDALSALVVLSYPALEVVYSSFRNIQLTEPYIPGFLAFREAHHILELIEELRHKRPELEPDCLLVDGNGILHPRGCGLACQIGVLGDLPTIGIGKNLLYVDGLTKEKVKVWMAEGDSCGGQNKINDSSATTASVSAAKFQRRDLVGDSGKTYGAAVAIPGVAKPIYVSIGHKVSLETAVALAVASSRHRVPEPVRQADLLSRDVIRKRRAWLEK